MIRFMTRSVFTPIIAVLALWAVVVTAPPSHAATDIEAFTTPGGVTVWLVQEPSIPMIAITVSFRGGTSLDPVGKEGATYLMAGLLEEGAGDMDAAAHLRATEELAARFSYRAYRDSVAITAEMLSENADQVVDLLRQALTNPTFDEVAFARVKAQVMSSLSSDETDPNEIAGRIFGAVSYPDHAYGTRDEGSTASVTDLTREDIVAAHSAALVRDRMYVGVVGDVTPERLGPMIDRLLGGLPEGGPDLPPDTEMAAGGGVTVEELNVPQSVAIFGHVGIDRQSPDYLTAYVLNEVFGGSGLSSRLNEEVREKRGLTYGVNAWLSPYAHATQVVGSVSSGNETIGEAIEVIRAEWRRMSEEGITAEELDRIKLYLTGSYPLRFNSNSAIAGNLVGMQVVGLPIDYIQNRNALVNAVTLEDANRVAAYLYQPDKLRFVVVGQPVGLSATE